MTLLLNVQAPQKFANELQSKRLGIVPKLILAIAKRCADSGNVTLAEFTGIGPLRTRRKFCHKRAAVRVNNITTRRSK